MARLPSQGSHVARQNDSSGDEYAAGSDTVVPAAKQPEVLTEFSGWVKEDLRRLMRMMAKLVRYPSHWEYQDQDGETQRLDANQFMELVNLAAIDLFFHKSSDADKLTYLGAKGHTARENPQFLDVMRSHPSYQPIIEDLKVKMRAIEDGTAVQELAPFFGGIAAFETAQTMLFGKKDRDRNDAAQQFLDRVDPKKSRGDGGGITFVFPPMHEETMLRTVEILREHAGEGSERDPAISAKRVNVPALPPASGE